LSNTFFQGGRKKNSGGFDPLVAGLYKPVRGLSLSVVSLSRCITC